MSKKYKYDICGFPHCITVADNSTLLLDDKGDLKIDQDYMSLMNQVFKSFIKFAKKNNIRWICQGGTLLGAARDSNGFLYFDNDIDVITFFKQSFNTLCKLQDKETEDGYILKRSDIGFNYHKKGRLCPWVDVWVYEKRPNEDKYIIAGPIIRKKPTYTMNFFWPKEFIYEKEMNDQIEVPFESYTVNIPRNYIEVVKRHFSSDAMTRYVYDPNKENHLVTEVNLLYLITNLESRMRLYDIMYSLNSELKDKTLYNIWIGIVKIGAYIALNRYDENMKNQIVNELVDSKNSRNIFDDILLKPALKTNIDFLIKIYNVLENIEKIKRSAYNK
jgi:hypothetical protein